jgi:hypothetical protein
MRFMSRALPSRTSREVAGGVEDRCGDESFSGTAGLRRGDDIPVTGAIVRETLPWMLFSLPLG